MYNLANTLMICLDDDYGALWVLSEFLHLVSIHFSILVFKNFCVKCFCCLLKFVNSVVVVVDHLHEEHAIPEMEFDVVWVNAEYIHACLVDLNETLAYQSSLLLNTDRSEVLFEQLSPESKGRIRGQAFVQLKLEESSKISCQIHGNQTYFSYLITDTMSIVPDL